MTSSTSSEYEQLEQSEPNMTPREFEDLSDKILIEFFNEEVAAEYIASIHELAEDIQNMASLMMSIALDLPLAMQDKFIVAMTNALEPKRE